MEVAVFGDHGENFKALGLPPWTPALASLTLTFFILEVTAGYISDGVDSCSVSPGQSFQ